MQSTGKARCGNKDRAPNDDSVRYSAISPPQSDVQQVVVSGIARIPTHSSNCQSTAPRSENFPSFPRSACQVLLFARHRCAESLRTLLRLALIGTNYSVYVSRDRTNSRWISWFRRKFALTPIPPMRASTLRTKLNRSSEWLLEFSSRPSIPPHPPSLLLARCGKFYFLIICPTTSPNPKLFIFHIFIESTLYIFFFMYIHTGLPLRLILPLFYSPCVRLAKTHHDLVSD